jgi:transitional endoplasmic reticulum ATPase
MTTHQFTVEKADPEDTGRGIARLDMDVIFRLRISPGDCIKIEGNTATVATVWRTVAPVEDTEIVRFDAFTRQNADIAIGDTVEIRNAEVTEASSLTLRTPEDSSDRFDADAIEAIKRQLLQRPVSEDDIVPVRATQTQLTVRSPGQIIPIIVSSTDPTPPVSVATETTVTIQ